MGLLCGCETIQRTSVRNKLTVVLLNQSVDQASWDVRSIGGWTRIANIRYLVRSDEKFPDDPHRPSKNEIVQESILVFSVNEEEMYAYRPHHGTRKILYDWYNPKSIANQLGIKDVFYGEFE